MSVLTSACRASSLASTIGSVIRSLTACSSHSSLPFWSAYLMLISPESQEHESTHLYIASYYSRPRAVGQPASMIGGEQAGAARVADSMRGWQTSSSTPAGTVVNPAAGRTRRLHDLDALRGFAMLLGIALHTALGFLPGLWPVEDSTATWEGPYDDILFVIHGFRMPVFFLMSGFFTAMLWRRRGLGSLLRHRFRRVLLPLGDRADHGRPAHQLAERAGVSRRDRSGRRRRHLRPGVRGRRGGGRSPAGRGRQVRGRHAGRAGWMDPPPRGGLHGQPRDGGGVARAGRRPRAHSPRRRRTRPRWGLRSTSATSRWPISWSRPGEGIRFPAGGAGPIFRAGERGPDTTTGTPTSAPGRRCITSGSCGR